MKNGNIRYKAEIISIVVAVLLLIAGLNAFTIVTAESEASVTSFGEVNKG